MFGAPGRAEHAKRPFVSHHTASLESTAGENREVLAAWGCHALDSFKRKGVCFLVLFLRVSQTTHNQPLVVDSKKFALHRYGYTGYLCRFMYSWIAF